ncbi:MAG: helix-turn-helix transcriptional regulator [Nostoc sp.]|uniref:helix-turn-helix transcriptional regulator n=1 Tax=Nostoc sp. TaxID=1180 RepID=UPI002FF0CBEF
MKLILSQSDYLKLLDQADIIQNNILDSFDITRKYQFGEGYWQQIHLRDGISLDISNYQQSKSLILKCHERKHPLEFRFLVLLESEFKDLEFKTGEYFLSGSGMASKCDVFEAKSQRIVEVAVHIHPNAFRYFTENTSAKLPRELEHLIRRWDQPTYERYGTQTPAMQIAVQQIIQCPYQGFKQVFGTTVFGYLHHRRMELAYKLLIEGNMKVTEVAQTVGYASLPSFSNAFRKKFGVTPKSCQK